MGSEADGADETCRAAFIGALVLLPGPAGLDRASGCRASLGLLGVFCLHLGLGDVFDAHLMH